MRRELSRLAVIGLVAVLVLQGVGVGFATSDVQSNETAESADEIYVEENGDAVLVYESPSGVDANRTEFGVDVTENLAYVLVENDVAGTPEVTGGFEATANRTGIGTEGNLSLPRPDALDSFELTADGVTTTEESRADLTLSTTILDESGTSALLKSASTNGTVTTTADRLTASMDAEADIAVPLPDSSHESLDFSLREDGEAYVLSMAQSRSVDTQFGDGPEDRSQFEQRLESQYGLLASEFGGTATVDVERYSIDESGDGTRIEEAYTVRFEGIDDGIGDVVRTQAAQDPQLSAEQADALASGLQDVEVREIALQYRIDDDGFSATFDADVANYGPLATAYFDLMGSLDQSGGTAADVERMEKRFAAQQAADLEQRFTWSGSVSHPDSERVGVGFEAQARSENWPAYVEELQARDVPVLTSSYEVTGDAVDDRVALEGRASVAGEQLYAELLRGLPERGEASAEAQPTIDAIRDSRPETARLVTTYDADGIHFEAGAAFGNLSALRDLVQEESDLPAVTEAVGRFDGDRGETTVRVASAVSADASESSVRALPSVDDETTVYMPGEGDREHPSMNVERAERFLESAEGTAAFGPGFGAVVAVAALVGAALLLGRRD